MTTELLSYIWTFIIIIGIEEEKKSIGNAPSTYSEPVMVPEFSERYIKKEIPDPTPPSLSRSNSYNMEGRFIAL